MRVVMDVHQHDTVARTPDLCFVFMLCLMSCEYVLVWSCVFCVLCVYFCINIYVYVYLYIYIHIYVYTYINTRQDEVHVRVVMDAVHQHDIVARTPDLCFVFMCCLVSCDYVFSVSCVDLFSACMFVCISICTYIFKTR